MPNLKSLAKETAIYGLSSIVGRFLNYLLVPLYTAKIAAASGGYGVITNVYAYTALFLVLLTYGMETTFFRYANKEGEDAMRVYSTVLVSVATSSACFVALVLAFLSPIAGFMGYEDHRSYVWVMALTVAIDAFQCIPFAYLRYRKKALKFAALKLLFIVANIGLNLVYFVLLPYLYAHQMAMDVVDRIYDPEVGAGYVFYINLACTASITFFLGKELRGFRYVFDRALWKRMMKYAMPILVLGIAGILNQTADKILYPFLDRSAEAHARLGIYGAASKIAMIMAMITQAFRYAYEPFVFGKAKEGDNRKTYAEAMKYFVIFTLLAFLVVTGWIDVIKYIIGRDYWTGLGVVPIVMVAEILMGVYFNLSFWYKLIDQTYWGAVFSGVGCAVLIAVNVMFVPKVGYVACAWAGVCGYGTATVLSYIVGQKRYKIDYPVRSITTHAVLAGVFFFLMKLAGGLPVVGRLAVNSLLILLFLGHILYHDLRITDIIRSRKQK